MNQCKYKHGIIQQFLPHIGTHQKAKYYIYAVPTLVRGLRKLGVRAFCNVKKNNKHSLIPVLATVTHTAGHGKSNMATHVLRVLHSSTTCSEATNRGYPQGSDDGELQNSLMVSL